MGIRDAKIVRIKHEKSHIFRFPPPLLVLACATPGPVGTRGAEPSTDVVIDVQPFLRFVPTPQPTSVGESAELRKCVGIRALRIYKYRNGGVRRIHRVTGRSRES